MTKHIMFISLPLMGHTNQMIVLAQELVGREYQVSFTISEELKEHVKSTGANLISWNPIVEKKGQTKNNNKDSIWDQVSKEANNWNAEKLMLKQLVKDYRPMYQSLKPILTKYKPDIIIVDRAMIPAMDLAWQMNLPCIVQSRYLGNFAKTNSNIPRFGTSYSIKMNQWEKFLIK